MLNCFQLAAKLPNLQEQAKAEELMKSNAALKKHEMELENEVVAGSLFLSKYCNRKEEQLAKLRKELKAKEAEHKRELDQISQKIMDEVASAKASSDSAASNQEVMKLGAQIKELKLSLGEVENSREEAKREVEKLSLLLTSKLDQVTQFKIIVCSLLLFECEVLGY
mmetsp:Transcript_56982/g.150134  ORF Transcript_56982/g.150134 Transcript_56982/m.150134 type:complete len:167 (-) Transcript_56982:338-838(-)